MELESQRIVLASEMARVEKMSIKAGASSKRYMLKAGEGIAAEIKRLIAKAKRERAAVLLIGKGNNGGDGYAAGTILKKAGYQLRAYRFFPFEELSELCQKLEKEFVAAGGEVICLAKAREVIVFKQGVIIDALFGTGFRGAIEGIIAEVITAVNNLPIPIIAIDIPSGVNGDSGAIGSVAIRAEKTLFLGAPKWGMFVNKGSDCVGQLSGIDFGLDPRYDQEMEPMGYLVGKCELSPLLPRLKQSEHKYQAGYLLALAGSPGMPGAACLTCLAALRSGAGMVRLFHPEGMELAHAPNEVVRTPYSPSDLRPLIQEDERASCWIIGPGLGQDEGVKKAVSTLLPQLKTPLVIDADALFCFDKWEELKSPCILTPHAGEMERLLKEGKLSRAALIPRCQTFCERAKVTLVLKGVPTMIFHPNTLPLVFMCADRGMATAGSGDVLTGIIAALFAKKIEPRLAAALGVYLHSLAGKKGAARLHSYSLIASDLIDSLPEAFRSLDPRLID